MFDGEVETQLRKKKKKKERQTKDAVKEEDRSNEAGKKD